MAENYLEAYPKMKIFASVGTHPQPFDRLLRQLDSIAAENRGWEVFAQTGNSNYKPEGIAFKNFLDAEEYDDKMRWCDLAVSHGGAGTIINALLNRKPLVVVPRMQCFKEHTNDHQVDLAMALDGKGKAICVKEIRNLGKAIKRAAGFKQALASERAGLVREIKLFLQGADR